MSGNKLHILFLIGLIGLTGCSLLKRERVTQHSGIERSDFNLPVFAYQAADSNNKQTLILMLSGDGGWLEFEDKLSLEFSHAGFTTIGFNSRDYFWERKTPRQTADDLGMLLRIYIRQYNPAKIVLCGYSFGADVTPFIYNRFRPRLKSRIASVALLSPFATTDFKVHTSDLLNIAKDNRRYKVKAEIDRIKVPILCFYGTDEEPKPQAEIINSGFRLKLLPGDHRYEDAALKTIVETISKEVNPK